MVKVEISYDKGGKFLNGLTVKGHANSGPYGNDIVCGAVTCMLVGACNALENDAENFDIELEEGNASILAKGPISEHDQVVLETLILQLKTIEVSPASKGSLIIKERK